MYLQKNTPYSWQNILFFLMSITVIFFTSPDSVNLKFLSVMGAKLSIYPILLLFAYTLIVKRQVNLFTENKLFIKFTFVYFTTILVSLLLGLWNYPYYDLILNGPPDQSDKLPKVYNMLINWGISISPKELLSIWMIARPIKDAIVQYLTTFLVSLLVYFWYKDNSNEGFSIFSKATLLSFGLVIIYGFLDVFYLAGSDVATKLLSTLNPVVHNIKELGSWWPPLLWENQLRSLFAEPSYFGIYMAFALPWLWKSLFDSNNKKLLILGWICNFIAVFFIFLTKARTANVLLLGEVLALTFLVFLYLPKKKKQLLGVILTLLLGFTVSLGFINYLEGTITTNAPTTQVTVSDYVEDNITSLASTNKRSNKSRYSIMITDLQIGKDNPILGVGFGLRNAYITDYISDRDDLSEETLMWINNQKEKGILKSGFPKLGEYTSRFSETGLVGLLLFLLPPAYLFMRLIKIIREKYRNNMPLDIEIFFLLSFLGTIAAGIGDSLDLTYAYWILLGLGFTLKPNNNHPIIK